MNFFLSIQYQLFSFALLGLTLLALLRLRGRGGDFWRGFRFSQSLKLGCMGSGAFDIWEGGGCFSSLGDWWLLASVYPLSMHLA